MQVRIISFDHPTRLIAQLQRILTGADVQHQPAVDLRNVSTDTLLKQNLITHATAQAIRMGRRWDHEAPSKGAIGLQHANRLALREDITQPLLLLEEDCVITDEARFAETVQLLRMHLDVFDIAAFGVLHTSQTHFTPVSFLPSGWFHIEDMFWGLHCVLYTPNGRALLSEHLHQAMDMQIDSLYGSMARVDQLRILGQCRNKCASQLPHISTIQTHLRDVQPIIRSIATILIICAGTLLLRLLLTRTRNLALVAAKGESMRR